MFRDYQPQRYARRKEASYGSRSMKSRLKSTINLPESSRLLSSSGAVSTFLCSKTPLGTIYVCLPSGHGNIRSSRPVCGAWLMKRYTNRPRCASHMLSTTLHKSTISSPQQASASINGSSTVAKRSPTREEYAWGSHNSGIHGSWKNCRWRIKRPSRYP